MTVSPPQPNSASYAHVCPEVDCIYYGKRTDPRGCGCHRTREQMMLARIEELKARAEQAEQAVDVLESNAREQAKLLADTGRRVEDLEALIEFWTSDGRLQTFEDRQRFRKAALAALPPSSSTGSTDMTLKARNDALHENNVLALRQIEELEAALLAAREYVAGASLAAGTPAYIRCCELLIKIDAALPHVRGLARAEQERGV